MKRDDLRAIMGFLRGRVRLSDGSPEDGVAIEFEVPEIDSMIAAGLDAEGSRRILGSSWWDEMVEDILDTPDMCDPDESPEQVLAFARDVVSEYIRKRAEL